MLLQGATTEVLLRETLVRSPKWARRLILSGYRGSHSHGTYIPPEDPRGTDDVDVFGVYVRGWAYYGGVTGYTRMDDTFTSAGETLDIESHELRKYLFLLCKGNPNVHAHLWLRPEHYFNITRAGRILLDRRRGFLSQKVLASFTGYAYDQLSRMQKFEKRGYMGAKREAIMQEHGYDIKNAAHCIRLLHTGRRLAESGELVIYLEGEVREEVLEVKRGLWTFERVRRRADELFRAYQDAKERALCLPANVDYAFADETAAMILDAVDEDQALA